LFNSTTIVDFADFNFNFSANTLKYTLEVFSWPFKSAGNKLAIEFVSPYNASDSSGYNNCDPVTYEEIEVGNYQYYQVNFHGFSMLIRFIDVAIIDNRQRYITFNFTDGIQVILPHFFSSALLDPDYNMLVSVQNSGTNDCGKDETSDIWIIIVSVVAVVVTLTASVLMYIFVRSKMRTNASLKRIASVLAKQNSLNSNSNSSQGSLRDIRFTL